VFAKFLTKFVFNMNRNPAKGFKLLEMGEKKGKVVSQREMTGFSITTNA